MPDRAEKRSKSTRSYLQDNETLPRASLATGPRFASTSSSSHEMPRRPRPTSISIAEFSGKSVWDTPLSGDWADYLNGTAFKALFEAKTFDDDHWLRMGPDACHPDNLNPKQYALIRDSQADFFACNTTKELLTVYRAASTARPKGVGSGLTAYVALVGFIDFAARQQIGTFNTSSEWLEACRLLVQRLPSGLLKFSSWAEMWNAK